MDLLAGYGSDTSDKDEPEKEVQAEPLLSNRVSGLNSGLAGATKIPDHDDLAQIDGAELFTSLPAPKTLPKKVLFTLPISREVLLAADDDEPPVKKLKPSGAPKLKLMDFLPPPKHITKAPAVRGVQAEDYSWNTAAASVTANTPYASESYPAVETNEAYRAYEHDDYAPTTAPAPGADAYVPAFTGALHQGMPSSLGSGPSASHAAPASSGFGLSGSHLLEQELQKERDRAVRRGEVITGELNVKEIRADELVKMDPGRREAATGLANALGPGFTEQLRTEAAPYVGSKTARRKHQIGTLFHNVKMRELEVLENKAKTMKTKSETQAKYGW